MYIYIYLYIYIHYTYNYIINIYIYIYLHIHMYSTDPYRYLHPYRSTKNCQCAMWHWDDFFLGVLCSSLFVTKMCRICDPKG